MAFTPRLVFVTAPGRESAWEIAVGDSQREARRVRQHSARRRVALLVAGPDRDRGRSGPADQVERGAVRRAGRAGEGEASLRSAGDRRRGAGGDCSRLPRVVAGRRAELATIRHKNHKAHRGATARWPLRRRTNPSGTGFTVRRKARAVVARAEPAPATPFPRRRIFVESL